MQPDLRASDVLSVVGSSAMGDASNEEQALTPACKRQRSNIRQQRWCPSLQEAKETGNNKQRETI